MVRVEFRGELNTKRFMEASRVFMREVVKLKRFRIVYILGRDIRVAYADGTSSNEVLIKFMLDNPAVSDVRRIEEVAE